MLSVFCTSLLARLAQTVNPGSAERNVVAASRRTRIERLPMKKPHQLAPYFERQDEESALVLTQDQCSELADKHGSLRESKKDWKATVQDPTGELHFPGSLRTPVDQQIGISNIAYTFAGSLYGMVDTEPLAEWHSVMSLRESPPLYEWSGEEGADREVTPTPKSKQCSTPTDEGSSLRQSKESRETTTSDEDSGENVQDIVRFRRPASPKDFVDYWEEHECLFEGLPRPRSTEQEYELTKNYYSFTNAGRILKELGKKTFLEKYGKGSVTKMQKDVAAETKRRKAAKEGQAAASAKGARREAPSIVMFRRYKSPKDFADHWEEQERLYQSLSHPFSPEQKREIGNNYYRLAAAGKLLKELGKDAFLKKYGQGSMNQMRMDVAAEIKRREAAEKDQKMAASIKDAEKEAPSIVKFRKYKSPEDFADHWDEQKRLRQSLPSPPTPEQRREIVNNYYRFVAAGKLIRELGRDAFLKTYGKGSINQMQKGVVAEIKRRKAAGTDQKATVSVRGSRKKVPRVASTSVTSSEDSVEQRPKQRRACSRTPRRLAYPKVTLTLCRRKSVNPEGML